MKLPKLEMRRGETHPSLLPPPPFGLTRLLFWLYETDAAAAELPPAEGRKEGKGNEVMRGEIDLAPRKSHHKRVISPPSPPLTLSSSTPSSGQWVCARLRKVHLVTSQFPVTLSIYPSPGHRSSCPQTEKVHCFPGTFWDNE